MWSYLALPDSPISTIDSYIHFLLYLPAFMAVECLSLMKLREYDWWWARHIVFGYLAMGTATDDRPVSAGKQLSEHPKSEVK